MDVIIQHAQSGYFAKEKKSNKNNSSLDESTNKKNVWMIMPAE